MSSLVKRKAVYALSRNVRPRSMARMVPYVRAARTGVRAARFMYRNRKTFVRYARAAKQRFSRANIGNPLHTNNNKGRTKFLTTQSHNTRTLYKTELTELPKGTNRNERERATVNLRGFKIWLEIISIAPNTLYCNVAILSPRSCGVVNEQEFFRDEGATDKSVNFGTAATGLDMFTCPINSDRYVILRHKRFRLVTGEEGELPPGNPKTVDLSGHNHRVIKWWIPLKRQLRYDSLDTNSPVDGRVFLVYWFDLVGAQITQSPTSNVVKMEEKIITYFKDPK